MPTCGQPTGHGSGALDDGNGILDDAAAMPPFEPGNGDDVNLGGPVRDWPSSWPFPVPNNAGNPVESAAVNWADSNIQDGNHENEDWGNPGKQHKTNGVFSD